MSVMDHSAPTVSTILIDSEGCAYAYFESPKMVARLDFNYGVDKIHWHVDLGRLSKDELKKKYPHASIMKVEDSRISSFHKNKIKGLKFDTIQ